MTDALWYLGRGAGVVSLTLLSLVVVLGVGSRSGRPVFGLPRFAVSLVHRNAALLAVVMLAIHMVSLLFDPYAQLKLVDLVMPFDAAYRALWLGLGTLAADLVVAVVMTSLLRHRLGSRTWRLVHWLTYVAWPVAVLHGLGTGTDATELWLGAVTGVCVAAVLAAVVWRCSSAFPGGDRLPRRAPSANPSAAPRPVHFGGFR